MLRRQSLGTRALRMEFGLAVVLEGWGTWSDADGSLRCRLKCTAARPVPRRPRQCTHDVVLRSVSVVCGVNQTQMCCSRESVCRAETVSHARFDRWICVVPDRFRTERYTVRSVDRPLRCESWEWRTACGCVSQRCLSRNLRLNVSERAYDRRRKALLTRTGYPDPSPDVSAGGRRSDSRPGMCIVLIRGIEI